MPVVHLGEPGAAELVLRDVLDGPRRPRHPHADYLPMTFELDAALQPSFPMTAWFAGAGQGAVVSGRGGDGRVLLGNR